MRFVLIGGYAGALRGSPMITGDLDSIEDLIRMKKAAGRTKDLIAVGWLTAVRDETTP